MQLGDRTTCEETDTLLKLSLKQIHVEQFIFKIIFSILTANLCAF